MKNYLKELIEENGIEILPLRPKHFVPKGEYVEMTRGERDKQLEQQKLDGQLKLQERIDKKIIVTDHIKIWEV